MLDKVVKGIVGEFVGFFEFARDMSNKAYSDKWDLTLFFSKDGFDVGACWAWDPAREVLGLKA